MILHNSLYLKKLKRLPREF